MATENILGLDSDVKDESKNEHQRCYKLLSMTGNHVLVPYDVVMRWPILSSYFLSDRWTVDKEGFQTYRPLEELIAFVNDEANKGVSIREEFGGQVAVVETTDKLKSGISDEDIIVKKTIPYEMLLSIFNKDVWVTIETKEKKHPGTYVISIKDDIWHKICFMDVKQGIIRFFSKEATFRNYILDNGPGYIGQCNILASYK